VGSDSAHLEGAVRSEDGDVYAEYMLDTGMEGYTRTPGNRLALMLRREAGETTEFMMFTLWESFEAIRAFAGDDPEKAVFYPEDDRFLIERDWMVSHFEVHAAAGIPT
jgi:heme-degrading monooxygenase HmoA